jgi:hypothetical protein
VTVIFIFGIEETENRGYQSIPDNFQMEWPVFRSHRVIFESLAATASKEWSVAFKDIATEYTWLSKSNVLTTLKGKYDTMLDVPLPRWHPTHVQIHQRQTSQKCLYRVDTIAAKTRQSQYYCLVVLWQIRYGHLEQLNILINCHKGMKSKRQRGKHLFQIKDVDSPIARARKEAK